MSLSAAADDPELATSTGKKKSPAFSRVLLFVPLRLCGSNRVPWPIPLQRLRILAFLSLLCLALAPTAQATLIWAATTWSHEARPGDQQLRAEFAFTNPGPAPVTIIDVASSCGCTVAALAQRTYQPGEAGTLEARFTLGDRVGPQHQTIRVETDTGAVQELTLHVVIPALVETSTRLLLWRLSEPAIEQAVEVAAAHDYRIARLEPVAGAVPARLETLEPERRYRLWFSRPAEPGAKISATYTVTLLDGSQQNFLIHLLTR